MAINVTTLASQIQKYFQSNAPLMQPFIYKKPDLFQYTTTLAKVKGNFPAVNTIIGNVVQGMSTTWNAVGDWTAKPNVLKAYDQKVNFEIVPDDIEGKWIAELNELGTPATERPITAYIFDDLMKATMRDVNYLSGRGVYNAGALTTFGNSMNGISKIISDGLTDSANPIFKIPTDAPTDLNIVDVIADFERALPSQYDTLFDNIYMSVRNAKRYAYRLRQLNYFSVGPDGMLKSLILGKNIIGLSCLDGDDNTIFTTARGNMLKLVDNDNMPMVDFVQQQDYKIKIALRFYLGVGFYTNELVYARVTKGSGSGLQTDLGQYSA